MQIKLELGDEVSEGTSKQGKIVTREGWRAAHLKHPQTPAEGTRFGDEEDDPAAVLRVGVQRQATAPVGWGENKVATLATV